MNRLMWELFKAFLFLSVYVMVDDKLTRMMLLGMYNGAHIGWYWAFARANRLLQEADTKMCFKYPFNKV